MNLLNTNQKKIIALTGLMGSGKTTIGAKLAKKKSYYFIDSDQEIEDQEMCSIKDIFDKKGEKYFRTIEKKVIKEIINRDEEIVLSLGGGSYMDEEIRNILAKKATTIWLYAPIDTILLRIGNKRTRPLLNSKNKFSNKRQLLEDLEIKRNPIYEKADYKFDTSNESHEDIVDKIIKVI
ncbi:MAG: shikimate kinase [Rickettsiales bacterium]|nr:shikimate kinase [Rickettsiales bacterium]